MKYPTLQKVSMTMIALVASLALSAQAGTRARVSSSSQSGQRQLTQRGHHAPMSARAMWHNKLSSTYLYDDGTSEQGVGFGNGAQNFESVWFNQFAVIPGAETINAVEVAWGSPVFPGFAPNGTPVTIGIWSDSNGDGDPSDAVLLGSVAGTVQDSDTDTFVTYTFSPAVTLPAGATSFFIGDLTPMNNGPENFWRGQDTSDLAPNKSWIAAMSSGAPADFNNLGNNDFLFTIDSQGLPGNWLIRGDSGNTTPTPTPTATPTPTPGNALWYNGDFDGVNGLSNELNTSLGQDQFASIYDDFIVPDGPGWDVAEVFSHNLADTNVTGATWEIRQGITEGNGGTLIAGDTTLTPVVTNIGPGGFGFPEIEVKVTGLSFHLDPGTYFLNVTPIGDLTGRSFDSTTGGANCVGTPCGNDQNAFWNSNFFGFNWTLTGNQGFPYDFSMGINAAGGGGGDLELKANARKVNGTNTTSLKWRGATSSDVDVFRSQQGAGGGFMLIATTPNDGSYKDSTGTTGKASFKYKVCEAGTQNCSNKTAVLFKQ